MQCCVGVRASKFEVLNRSGSRDTTSGWCIHFSADPAINSTNRKLTEDGCERSKYVFRSLVVVYEVPGSSQ